MRTTITSIITCSSFALVTLIAAGCPLPADPSDDGTAAETGDTSADPATGTTADPTADDTTGEPTTDDPTTGDPITSETTVEPTTEDPTTGYTGDTSDTGDTGETTDTTTGEPGSAMIRFINLSDGPEARFAVDDQPAATLAFTQAQQYLPFPAGAHDLSAIGIEDNVLSNLIGYEFEAGKKYTVAGMGLHGAGSGNPTMWVNVDVAVDAVDIPAAHTRLTLVNATPDVDNGVYSQLVYDNDFFIDFYEEKGEELLGYVQQVTVDCPAPTVEQLSTMALAAQWGVPAVTEQYWKAASFLLVAPDDSIYVFLTCTGACDSNEDRFVLGLQEDGTTFTVETL